MIPLAFAGVGGGGTVKRLGGAPEVKKHLEDLGFSAGSEVVVIAESSGNIIVKVKEARIAISREMAQKIMI